MIFDHYHIRYLLNPFIFWFISVLKLCIIISWNGSVCRLFDKVKVVFSLQTCYLCNLKTFYLWNCNVMIMFSFHLSLQLLLAQQKSATEKFVERNNSSSRGSCNLEIILLCQLCYFAVSRCNFCYFSPPIQNLVLLSNNF